MFPTAYPLLLKTNRVYLVNLKFMQNAFDRLGQDGDALKQIQENTQITAEAVVQGGELFDRIDRMVNALEKIETATKAGQGGLQEAIVLKLVAPTLKPIGLGMQFIVEALNNLPDAKEAGEKMDALTKGLVVLGDVGASILKFAGFMILATPLLLVTAVLAPIWMGGLFLITKGLMMVTESLDKERLEKISMLGDVGKSLLILAGSLALVALLAIPAMIGLIASTVLLVGIAGVFKLLDMIGADPQKMEDFGDSIRSLGIGLLLLGGTLALLSIVAMPVLKGLAVAIAVVAGIGLTFFLLDKLGIDKSMRKFSMDLLVVSLALVTLGAALAIMNLLVPPMEESLYLLAVVGGVALVFGIAGLFAKQIAKGALAIGLASLALVVLGFGLQMINKGMPAQGRWEFIGQVGAIVGGLAIVMALAGAGFSLIAQGAIGMILSAASLIVLGYGLSEINKGMPEKDRWEFIGQVGALVGGLGVAMALAGAGAMFIIPGAAAMILAGGALVAIGKGLQALAKVDFSTLGTVAEKGSKPFNFSGEVTKGFLGIGGGRKKTNFEVAMSSIADGLSLGPLSVLGIMAGAPTLLLAGGALIAISAGIRKFTEIAKDADLPALSGNVRLIVSGLADTFAEVGTKYPGGGSSFMSMLTGNTSGQSVVAQGISAVSGMGKALTGIAKGVQAMAMLKFPTGFDKEGNPTGFETIDLTSAVPNLIANTRLIVTGLSQAFAEVGESDAAQGGGWFSKSPYEKGVKVVKLMGEPLARLAEGVQAMANLKFPTGFDKDGNPTGYESIGTVGSLVKKLKKNTKAMIIGLASTFEEVGKSGVGGDGGWFSASSFEKGIEITNQLGEPYKNLAGAVEDVAKITKGVSDATEVREKVTAMIDAITGGPEANPMFMMMKKQLIATIGTAYTQLGNSIPKIVQAVGTFTVEKGKAFQSIFGGESTPETFAPKRAMLLTLSKSYMRMAMAIPMIIGSINTVEAEQMSAFTEIYGGKMFEVEAETLNTRATLFTAVGDSYEKVGTAMPQISSAVNSIEVEKAKLFKNMFVGEVGLFKLKGYEAQAKLWKAIGSNMMTASIAMPTMAAGINTMDLEKLTETRQMFEALATLSGGGDGPEDILAKMGESLETALENLTEMIETFRTTVETGNAETGGILEGAASTIGGAVGAFRDAARGSGGNVDVAPVVRAIKKLEQTISSGIPVTGDFV